MASACDALGVHRLMEPLADNERLLFRVAGAAAAFSAGCWDGDNRACYHLGELGIFDGTAGPTVPTEQQAKDLLHAACMEGLGGACWERSFLSEEEVSTFEAVMDPTAWRNEGLSRAAEARKACEAGERAACEALSDEFGPGKAARAARVLELACALGSGEACLEQGLAQLLGVDRGKDVSAGVESLAFGCYAGEANACFLVGLDAPDSVWFKHLYACRGSYRLAASSDPAFADQASCTPVDEFLQRAPTLAEERSRDLETACKAFGSRVACRGVAPAWPGSAPMSSGGERR